MRSPVFGFLFARKNDRTADLNPAIELRPNGNTPFERAQKKQVSIFRDLSCLAPLPGLISNQVYEGFAKLYELRAFLNIDGNKGIQAQC